MQAGTPLSIETPPKSSGNTDQGLMKNIFNDILSEFVDIPLSSYVGGGGEGKICHLKLFSKLNLLSLLLSRMVVHELVIVMESYG